MGIILNSTTSSEAQQANKNGEGTCENTEKSNSYGFQMYINAFNHEHSKINES